MAYKVVKQFYDLQDHNHLYKVGDKYPHDDKTVAKKRLEELSTIKNSLGEKLIVEIKEKK